MGERIRQLEDALAIFQSNTSSETHSLLRDDLLVVKLAPDRNIAPDIEDPLGGNATDSIDARGILTVGDQGGKYYGAGTEVCSLQMQKTIISWTDISSGIIPGMIYYPRDACRLQHLQSGWCGN
jgi:hypothetical protein